MKVLWPVLIMLLPLSLSARLEVVVPETMPAVFGGGARRIPVVLHNAGSEDDDVTLRLRLLQASSATVMPVDGTPWKRMRILAGQTVLESITLVFPSVRATTMFLVQFVDEQAHAFGLLEVMAFPTNLLEELRPLSRGLSLGVLDPQNKLKPLLTRLGVPHEDLEKSTWEHFTGRLAIIGPFASAEQMPAGTAKTASLVARRGTSLVWILPPVGREPKPESSDFPLSLGAGHAVVVTARSLERLEDNPVAQLNLVRLCRLALNPRSSELAQLKP